MSVASRSLRLSDGTPLHALEAGEGRPLIMIPGWSQSAAEFGRNLPALAERRHVVALDMRGHGESGKPAGGYRLSRLAKDLAEVIDGLGFGQIDLLGHSMGNSVIWNYLDSFGTERVRRIVVVDQAPAVAALPAWGESERACYGCLLPDVQAAAGFADTVRATTTVEGTMEFIRGMFTAAIAEADLRWIATENLKMPREKAADLLFNHCTADWRDVIGALRLPLLSIGGESSIFSARSQRWIAEQNPNGRASIFPAAEGGGHFVFFENPERFNAEVAAFLDQ